MQIALQTQIPTILALAAVALHFARMATIAVTLYLARMTRKTSEPRAHTQTIAAKPLTTPVIDHLLSQQQIVTPLVQTL